MSELEHQPSDQNQPAPGFTQPDWNAAAANVRTFDARALSPFDLAIMAMGVLGFLLSFAGFYKYSVKVTAGGAGVSFGASGTVSAWHGFFGWFGVLAGLAAALILAADLIAKIPLPFNVRLVTFAAAAVAAVCLLLALVVVPGNTGVASGFGIKIDKGHGWAYWIVLLMSLASAGLSFKRLKDTSSR
jgi:hypothetical protein